MMGILEKLNPLVISENMTQYSKPQWSPNNKDIEVKAGNFYFLIKALFSPLLRNIIQLRFMLRKEDLIHLIQETF